MQTGDMFFEESTQKHLDLNQCPLAGWNRHRILWMDHQLLLGDKFLLNWICWVENDTFCFQGHANTKSYCLSTCKPRCFNTSRSRYVSSTSCERVRCGSFWNWLMVCYLWKHPLVFSIFVSIVFWFRRDWLYLSTYLLTRIFYDEASNLV